MKSLFLVSLALLLFVIKVSSQGTCASSVKIISPVVAKPTDAKIVSASCTELVLNWKTSSDQTSFASLVIKNGSNPDIMDTVFASNTICSTDGSCTATFLVTPGAVVSWNIQATKLLDDQTFYSYPLRSAQAYTAPNCLTFIPPVLKTVAGKEKTIALAEEENMKVEIYPNPVHTALTFNLNNIAKRSTSQKEVIRVFDVNGKTVITLRATGSSMLVNVSRLSSGIYFIRLEDSKGKLLYIARFIKD